MQRGQHSGVHPAHAEPLASEPRQHCESARVTSFAEAQGELNLHARIRLGGCGDQRRVEQRAAFSSGEPVIGELEGMNANGRVGVADEPLHVGWRERADLVERAQCDDDGGWLGVFIGKQFAQRRRSILFAAFNQQTLRGLSPPEERAGTFAGESPRIERAHVGGGSGPCVAVGEAIDAAAVVAGIEAVLLLEMTRNGRVILDDFAVVVGDPD